MKKLFFLLLAVLSIAKVSAISKQAAFNRISSFVDQTTMNVYCALIVQSKLPTEVTTTGLHWVFFVDEEPNKGWAHNCTYYYIPYSESATPTYTAVHASMPRTDLNLSWYKGTTFGIKKDINLGYANLSPNQLNTANKVHAIILSGGVSKYSNYIRYWNDCSFIYQTLVRHYGVPKSQISVIMADGTDPAADIPMGSGTFISSPTDLDGDGVADIQYAATKSNVISELSRMRENLTEQDKLLIFVTDHGGSDDYNTVSYINLWNNEKLYDYEMAAQLDSTKCRYINIVMGQCFSGGFVDNLKGHSRVIMTACAGNEYSWAKNDLNFDEFVYHWTSAINEKDYFGTSVDADSDDDGMVSMHEAFTYATNHDMRNESPQYKSVCEKIGDRSTLHTFSTKSEFIIRDLPEDIGIEPTMSDNSWSSPDIVQRQNNDSIYEHESVQITQAPQMMYTWVKVTNVGSEDYMGNGWYIHLYWANAIAGISLQGWLGANNSNGHQMGSKCETQLISDTIPVGESKWIKILWLLPYNVSNYIINDGGWFHLCLLARVTRDCYDNDMDIMQMPNNPYQADVMGDRRIAQKNLSVFSNSRVANQGMTLLASNIFDAQRDYSFEVRPAYGDSTSLQHLQVAIELSDTLYESWQNNGMVAERMVSLNSRPRLFLSRGTSSKISNVKFAPNQVCNIRCYGRVIADEDINEPRTYFFSVIQRDRQTGKVVGGEDFQIRQQPRKAIEPIIKTIELDGNYLLKATNIDEPAHYSWFDENGSKVGEGQEISLQPTKKQAYTLRVEAEKDGSFNYAQINLNASQGFKRLSPMPFNTQLNIELKRPAIHGTKIQIVPVSAHGHTEEFDVLPGETGMTIYTANYAKGIYAVCLLINDKIVETRQIAHE